MSVGGIPVPIPGRSRSAPQVNGVARDPDVLHCNAMSITSAEEGRLHLAYEGVGDETMRKGEYRGRKSSWSDRAISQSYKTTSRKVDKDWQLRSDGRLLVTVKLNPKGEKARTFKRVFERPSDATSPDPHATQQ